MESGADPALVASQSSQSSLSRPSGFDPGEGSSPSGWCGYWDCEWECREGGYLWDTDGDGYDPSDCSYPCPACNTREYLGLGVENAQTLTAYQWVLTSGAEQWRYRVDAALTANPREAPGILAEIGPVDCLDWADPEAPHFDHTITVIENVALARIEARSDATPKSGAAEGESAGRKALPETKSESQP